MRKDVLKWYNEFWRPTFESATIRSAAPTPAHEALAKIARRYPRARVVTQNVDGLHCAAIHGERGIPDPQLVEAHGRCGIFRCAGFDAAGKHGCERCAEDKARDTWYEVDELLDEDREVWKQTSSLLKAAPKCPSCKIACAVPVALLFDEIYDAHFFFEADAWDAWLDDMDAVVFVGTSFAVELTREALRRSRHRNVPAFDVNVNLAPLNVVRSDYLRTHTLQGDCQGILPRLAFLCTHAPLPTPSSHDSAAVGPPPYASSSSSAPPQ